MTRMAAETTELTVEAGRQLADEPGKAGSNHQSEVKPQEAPVESGAAGSQEPSSDVLMVAEPNSVRDSFEEGGSLGSAG